MFEVSIHLKNGDKVNKVVNLDQLHELLDSYLTGVFPVTSLFVYPRSPRS